MWPLLLLWPLCSSQCFVLPACWRRCVILTFWLDSSGGVERWDCLPALSCWHATLHPSLWMLLLFFLSDLHFLPFINVFPIYLFSLFSGALVHLHGILGRPAPCVVTTVFAEFIEPIKTIKYIFGQVLNLLLSVGQPPGGSVCQFVPNLLFRVMWDNVCDTDQSPENGSACWRTLSQSHDKMPKSHFTLKLKEN